MTTESLVVATHFGQSPPGLRTGPGQQTVIFHQRRDRVLGITAPTLAEVKIQHTIKEYMNSLNSLWLWP